MTRIVCVATLAVLCWLPGSPRVAAAPQIRSNLGVSSTRDKPANTIAQSPRGLPVTCQADVIVAGGGLAGVTAALRAASEGLSVVLVEERNCLGHELTTSWDAVPGGVTVPQACPAARRLLSELKRQKGISAGGIEPQRARNPLHSAVAAATPRIRVFFASLPAGAVLEQGRLRGIVVANRAGRQVFWAKAVIDATEDARVAAAAGVERSPVRGDLEARRQLAVDPMPSQTRLPKAFARLNACEIVVGRQYLTLICRMPRSDDLASDWSQAQATTLQRAVALRDLLERSETKLKSFAISPEISSLNASQVRCRATARDALDVTADDAYRALGVDGLIVARPQLSETRPSPSVEMLLVWGDVAGRLASQEAKRGLATLQGDAGGAPSQKPPVAELLAGPDPGIRYPRLREEACSLPVVASVDVLVVGGGTSGALAAIAAARQKAHVALVEILPNLGGTSSNRVNGYYWGVPWKSALSDEIDKPIKTEPSSGASGLEKVRFSGEEKKIVLQDLAAKTDVRLFYRSLAVGALVEDRRVIGVVTENASGRQAVRAKVVIDATGHGDVAAAAGAAFDVGRPRDGFLHEAEHGPLRDALDPEDLSKYYLRHPSTALSLNIRESRRIRGDCTVTLNDVLAGRRFPDVVARWRSNYDSHFPHSANEEDLAQDWMAILGLFRKPLWGDIPYRAILPAGLENILVVGKSYSATHDALIGARMQRDLQHLGEAAGVAAAMACRAKTTPRKLPVEPLQEELVRLGVLLPEDLTDARRAAPSAPPIDVAATAARLGGDRALDAMVDLYLAGPAAVPSLLPLLSAEQVAQRTEAALVLGMLGRHEAAPVLLDRLRQRDPRRFAFTLPNASSRSSVPVYWSAVILLGRMRVREAAGPIAELLEDPQQCPPSLASFAIVALGRIGERSVVPAIRPYLKVSQKTDLRQENMEFESHWGVRTNAARALAELGDDSGLPVLVELLEADQSRLRHYAQRLLEQTTGQTFGKDREAWRRYLRTPRP